MLYKCIGISGLQGLDHLLGVLIMTNLNSIIKQLEKECDQATRKNLISSFNALKHFNSFNERYEQVVFNLKKTLRGINATIIPLLMKVGQFTFLRDMINLQLQMLAKVGSNRLYLVLENLNKTILNDIVNREYTE